MFLIDSLRSSIGKASPVALHLSLICGVVLYTVCGAVIMRYLENPSRISVKKNEITMSEMNETKISKIRPCLLLAVSSLFESSKCEENSLDSLAISAIDDCYMNALAPRNNQPKKLSRSNSTAIAQKWTFDNALIFSFTVITTIGYGHVVPETNLGRAFVILYGLIGVPLTLLTIADLGMFISKILSKIVNSFYRKVKGKTKKNEEKKEKEDDNQELTVEGEKTEEEKKENKSEDSSSGEDEQLDTRGGEAALLCTIFLIYLTAGARVLASYEPDMDFFTAFYFNFVTLTTIGLGDFVPKRYDYHLVVTLCYIGIGLALTTMAIEIAADALKKLHYFGRGVGNAANAVIWIGGKKITMKRLLKNLGDQFDIPVEEFNKLNVTKFVDSAIKVEAGEIKTLRKPDVVFRPQRALSYSNLRKSTESEALKYVDDRSSRSREDGTGRATGGGHKATSDVTLQPAIPRGIPPLAEETGRSITTNRKALTVRFSQLSFTGSETTNSMDYSQERDWEDRL